MIRRVGQSIQNGILSVAFTDIQLRMTLVTVIAVLGAAYALWPLVHLSQTPHDTLHASCFRRILTASQWASVIVAVVCVVALWTLRQALGHAAPRSRTILIVRGDSRPKLVNSGSAVSPLSRYLPELLCRKIENRQALSLELVTCVSFVFALHAALTQFDLICTEIRRYGGVVDSFLGDGVLAYWPVDCASAVAARAGYCALGIQQAIQGFNWVSSNLPSIRARIGLDMGAVSVGTVGTSTSGTFTIFGRAAHTACCLEALNKEIGTAILLTTGMAVLLPDALTHRPVGSARRRGDSPILISELLLPGVTCDARDLALGTAEVAELAEAECYHDAVVRASTLLLEMPGDVVLGHWRAAVAQQQMPCWDLC
ncbi:Adenylate and Guanylate cyclase catalytic domain [Carpediemonas membranifera]|uniref:Adenylate and Guanylate cyclase catalytic domain n=1 Tax=Carpediemonas membranifera TaxID=201153 RepID=A0A8J6AT38_9EUKA|nr:Adenylate and Guanylate cyclase catalytic domain [Carpediemonas membranifera]|eukprot:KAG9393403.1 Adenylate and Guanylate cyclase catalytic domain [Carpediemonas membranifera]